jgi:glycosyltransferase involved in cell wall biosynthesis
VPQFSVVIPAHNRPQLLLEAIESVRRQTVTDWEIVVVDDGSNPPLVVPDDSRIRLVRHPVAAGRSAARNAGVAASDGALLAFLDDDDFFTEDRLEIALEGLERSPVATCWIRVFGQPTRSNVVLQGDVSDTILDRLTPSLGATAVRRESFLPFDEQVFSVEDVDWWLRTAAVVPVVTVPRVGYVVRPRSSVDAERLGQLRQRVEENLDLLDRYQDYFGTHSVAAAFRLKRAGLMLLDLQDAKSARRVLARSFRLHPSPSTARHLARAVRPTPTSHR